MSLFLNKKIQNLSNNITKEENKNDTKGINTTHNSKFLIQLYQILEDNNNKNIIHWSGNGKYFIIEDLNEFIEKILPKYYNHSNYASFVRQLNMYNFHKIKSDINENSFQNNNFIKGEKELISNILRKKKRKKNINNKENNITSLVKYNQNNYFSNLNTQINNYENRNNSLSLDEDNENKIDYKFNINKINNSMYRYNSKSAFSPMIKPEMTPLKLKQELMTQSINNSHNNNNKISKKKVYNLLNNIINNVDQMTKRQKKLNAKIDSLYSKNSEYINKNKTKLDEINSISDYNKNFEILMPIILRMKNLKPIMKNRLLINSSNNNENELINNDIINSLEQSKEINIKENQKNINENNNNNEAESFQSFLNKYIEKNKITGLLMSSEINKTENNNKNGNDKSILKNSKLNINKSDNISVSNESIYKDNFGNHKNSIDTASLMFKRNRSNSIFSAISNENSLFGNGSNINNKSEINWNNNIESNNTNNNINKSFELESNMDKNSIVKDSLNNSSLSIYELPNKAEILDNNFKMFT